jgi:hypothetical protein
MRSSVAQIRGPALYLRGSLVVTVPPALFGERGEVRPGVHQETLTFGDLRELHQRVLVFWHYLQHLL